MLRTNRDAVRNASHWLLAADRAGLLDHEDDEAGGRQGEDERGKAVGSCARQLRGEQGDYDGRA